MYGFNVKFVLGEEVVVVVKWINVLLLLMSGLVVCMWMEVNVGFFFVL